MVHFYRVMDDEKGLEYNGSGIELERLSRIVECVDTNVYHYRPYIR